MPWRIAILALAWTATAWAAEPGIVDTKQQFLSPAAGHRLSMAIYRPAAAPGEKLPVIYLLHGVNGKAADWLTEGHLPETADRLIASGQMPPALIVMPDSGNSWYVDAPHGGGAMARAIWQDLPAWIEAHYPVRRDRGGRAIAGYSMGGFGATRLSFIHPDRYIAVAALSGAFWTTMSADMKPSTAQLTQFTHIFGRDFGAPFDPALFVAESPMTLVAALAGTPSPPAIYLTCGRQDRYNLAAEQVSMAERLDALHLPYEAHLTEGDHDWDTWAAALPDMLVFLGRHFTPGGTETVRPERIQ